MDREAQRCSAIAFPGAPKEALAREKLGEPVYVDDLYTIEYDRGGITYYMENLSWTAIPYWSIWREEYAEFFGES